MKSELLLIFLELRAAFCDLQNFSLVRDQLCKVWSLITKSHEGLPTIITLCHSQSPVQALKEISSSSAQSQIVLYTLTLTTTNLTTLIISMLFYMNSIEDPQSARL